MGRCALKIITVAVCALFQWNKQIQLTAWRQARLSSNGFRIPCLINNMRVFFWPNCYPAIEYRCIVCVRLVLWILQLAVRWRTSATTAPTRITWTACDIAVQTASARCRWPLLFARAGRRTAIRAWLRTARLPIRSLAAIPIGSRRTIMRLAIASLPRRCRYSSVSLHWPHWRYTDNFTCYRNTELRTSV